METIDFLDYIYAVQDYELMNIDRMGLLAVSSFKGVTPHGITILYLIDFITLSFLVFLPVCIYKKGLKVYD